MLRSVEWALLYKVINVTYLVVVDLSTLNPLQCLAMHLDLVQFSMFPKNPRSKLMSNVFFKTSKPLYQSPDSIGLDTSTTQLYGPSWWVSGIDYFPLLNH